jgi:hypothetical protein
MPPAFVKAGLSTLNNREITMHKAALSTKKAAIRTRLRCARATKP